MSYGYSENLSCLKLFRGQNYADIPMESKALRKQADDENRHVWFFQVRPDSPLRVKITQSI